MTTNPIGNMLSRDEIIKKLQELPDLPVVFMGQFGGFGMVRHVEISTVRQYKDGKINIIDQRSTARHHLGEGAEFQKWVEGKFIQVIAITGI